MFDTYILVWLAPTVLIFQNRRQKRRKKTFSSHLLQFQWSRVAFSVCVCASFVFLYFFLAKFLLGCVLLLLSSSSTLCEFVCIAIFHRANINNTIIIIITQYNTIHQIAPHNRLTVNSITSGLNLLMIFTFQPWSGVCCHCSDRIAWWFFFCLSLPIWFLWTLKTQWGKKLNGWFFSCECVFNTCLNGSAGACHKISLDTEKLTANMSVCTHTYTCVCVPYFMFHHFFFSVRSIYRWWTNFYVLSWKKKWGFSCFSKQFRCNLW